MSEQKWFTGSKDYMNGGRTPLPPQPQFPINKEAEYITYI